MGSPYLTQDVGNSLRIWDVLRWVNKTTSVALSWG